MNFLSTIFIQDLEPKFASNGYRPKILGYSLLMFKIQVQCFHEYNQISNVCGRHLRNERVNELHVLNGFENCHDSFILPRDLMYQYYLFFLKVVLNRRLKLIINLLHPLGSEPLHTKMSSFRIRCDTPILIKYLLTVRTGPH